MSTPTPILLCYHSTIYIYNIFKLYTCMCIHVPVHTCTYTAFNSFGLLQLKVAPNTAVPTCTYPVCSSN